MISSSTFDPNYSWGWRDRLPWQLAMHIFQATTLITTVIYFRRRDRAFIRERAPQSATLVCAIASCGVTWINLSDHAYGHPSLRTALPCWAHVWMSYTSYMTYMFASSWRWAQLLCKYHACQVMAAGEWCKADRDRKIAILSWLRLRVSSERLFMKSLAVLVAVIWIYVLGIMDIVIDQNQYDAPESPCFSGLDYIPLWMTMAFWMLVLSPIALYWLRGVRDLYYIKHDIAVSATGCILSFFIFCFLRFAGDFEYVRPSFPFLLPVSIVAIAAHLTGVGVPILQSYDINPASLFSPKRLRKLISQMEADNQLRKIQFTEQHFHLVLTSPRWMERLKEFAARDFSIENVLFLEEYQGFLEKCKPHAQFFQSKRPSNVSTTSSSCAASKNNTMTETNTTLTGVDRLAVPRESGGCTTRSIDMPIAADSVMSTSIVIVASSSTPATDPSTAAATTTTLTAMAPLALPRDAEDALHTIMERFILPRSPYEINVTAGVRASVVEQYQKLGYSRVILDDVAREIKALVFTNTFARFVRNINENRDKSGGSGQKHVTMDTLKSVSEVNSGWR